MERRNAVIAAATATLTLAAAAVAISINSSIVGASDHGGAGGIDPVATQVTEDVPSDRDQRTVTVPDDEHEQDDEYEQDEHSTEQYEHEYEGADDDD